MRLIISADWHIRATMPRCRKDNDWYDTQYKAIRQIEDIAISKNCDVAIVGDIFHSNSDTTMECVQLVQDFAKNLRKEKLKCYVLCGNHDLVYHSTQNLKKSAIGVLLKSTNIYPLSSLSDEVSAGNFDEETEDKEIIFKHILCFPDYKSMPPNVDAVCAKELLEEYKNAQWIFLGDYHKAFHYEKNNRHVVNPGCILRQASDFKDYKCGVFFVDTEKNICEFIPIIDNEEFVDDSYIIKEEERNARIEKFINKLADTEQISLDFVENVRQAMLVNKFKHELKEVIEELLDA